MDKHTETALEKSRRNITEIIIHCTATPAGRNVTVSDVDNWHRQRGFSSIGYHYLVELNGNIAIGRPVDQCGAHCIGHNSHSIGVVYAGGLDAGKRPCDTRTAAQKESLLSLLKMLKKLYPDAKIHSHSDFAPKACPCFNATAEYSRL